jgi:hypothetical protein
VRAISKNCRCVLVALGLAALSGAQQSPPWDSYANQRFTYSVEYPTSLLKPQAEAGNGDGREFHARTGTARIAVWGSYVGNGNLSAKEQAATTEADCGSKAAYRLDRPPIQAVSCLTKAGEVLYYKSRQRKDVLVTIEGHYPSTEKAKWDPVIARMAQSLFVGESEDS